MLQLRGHITLKSGHACESDWRVFIMLLTLSSLYSRDYVCLLWGWSYIFIYDIHTSLAVLWLRRLVSGLSPWGHWFDAGPEHVRFAVDGVFLRVLRLYPASIIPPILHLNN